MSRKFKYRLYIEQRTMIVEFGSRPGPALFVEKKRRYFGQPFTPSKFLLRNPCLLPA